MKASRPRKLLRWSFAAALAMAQLAPAWGFTTAQPAAAGAIPASYAATGVLAAVSPENQTLTISGNVYRYSAASLKVRNAAGVPATIQSIAAGAAVMYTVSTTGGGTPSVTEIQVVERRR